MRAVEGFADALGEIGGDQPVDGVALGRHGAAFGGGDQGGDLLEPLLLAAREAVLAEAQRGDQRAMHDQVGIAADRRGEMRVAPQVEAEMADIVGRISAWLCERSTTSLTSASWSAPSHLVEDPLNCEGRSCAPRASDMAERRQELAQAIPAWRARARRGCGRPASGACASSVSAAATLAWIMNSSISLWASRRSGTTTRSTVPSALSRILRSGRSSSSGWRAIAAALQHRIGRPQRLQHRFEERRRSLSSGRAVDRRLRLRIGRAWRPSAS